MTAAFSSPSGQYTLHWRNRRMQLPLACRLSIPDLSLGDANQQLFVTAQFAVATSIVRSFCLESRVHVRCLPFSRHNSATSAVVPY